MGVYWKIPHRPAMGMCPVNGIRDLVQWRSGRDWSNAFVWGLGLGGGFAYIRVNVANPPRQIFTGNATPRQHRYLADLLCAPFFELENRAFQSAWAKACEAVDQGRLPILGPLDMYYLPYYEGIYHQRHIPIHFFLLAGYDLENAWVYDTALDAVQEIPLTELRLAWNMQVPGLGKRNRLALLDIPADLPRDEDLIRHAVADQAQFMLRPPVNMLGLPAMRKVAREIAGWPGELGETAAEKCLHQAREYLNSPPDEHGNNLTAGRDRYIAFLQEAMTLAPLNFLAAIDYLRQSMEVVPELAAAMERRDLSRAATCFTAMADAETSAYISLTQAVQA